MPSVQLERLRPQVNAIVTQYENSDVFCKSLIALLRTYSSDVDPSFYKITSYSILPTLNVPQVVLNQLEIAFKHLSQKYPIQTKATARVLWGQNIFETKQIALFLLANLPTDEIEFFITMIDKWVDADIEMPIINHILETISTNAEISNDPRWINLIESWVNSSEIRLQKIGISALTYQIELDGNNNLPKIFRLIEPIFSKPNVSINSDLLNLVESLVNASEPETAAFLIHLAAIYPNPEISSFLRKCLPKFNAYFSSEIKKALKIL